MRRFRELFKQRPRLARPATVVLNGTTTDEG